MAAEGTIASAVRRIKRRSLAALDWAGRQGPSPLASSFYEQQASCQVPNLGWYFSRFLGERADGHFVEVGAFDGVYASNTWGLAARGWSGLLVEPVPEFATLCRLNHAKHPNIDVQQTAVGPPDCREVTIRLAGALSTANPVLAHEYQRTAWAAPSLSSDSVTVPCTTLDRILETSGTSDIDLLVIDVEGYEASVFEGFTTTRWVPKMMIVELADAHPDLTATASQDFAVSQHILKSGYAVVYKDPINTLFVRFDIIDAALSEQRLDEAVMIGGSDLGANAGLSDPDA